MMKERVRQWIADDPDASTRRELEELLAAGAWDDLEDRFAGRLTFGTAGLRGLLGGGPNRMNRAVVRRASAGVAAYLAEAVPRARERGVVVAYDARRMSRELAEDTARVFLGAGFKVYLSRDVTPTPVLAFAVTHFGAAAGAMITASHNPPAYNGYKVYWENGAQIVPPVDRGISEAIDAVGPVLQIPLGDLSAAVPFGDDVEARYLEGARALMRDPGAAKNAPLRIAYTPLHGVGARLVETLLGGVGFEVHTVPEQREPDGAFPTVEFPNPEEKGAMDRVLALAKQINAELVLASDPDVDRLAVALPASDGYRMLTGDQVGGLLADYLLGHKAEGDVPRMVATTIVSSQLLEEMARRRGVAYRETLTGFKWIANAALSFERETGGRFVMGYEEALGYCIGDLVRDKDGITAALLFAELAAVARAAGQTVWQRLEAIYRENGLYLSEQVSLVLPGREGLGRMRSLMARMREAPPAEIAGARVRERRDLLEGFGDLPRSDVLIFLLEGGRRVIMRPSGTEPKLKSYYEVRETLQEKEPLEAAMERARASLAALRDAHQALLVG